MGSLMECTLSGLAAPECRHCDQCHLLRVNGVVCHEIGCPEAWKDYDVECVECGCDFAPHHRHQKTCDDCELMMSGWQNDLVCETDEDGEVIEETVFGELVLEEVEPDPEYDAEKLVRWRQELREASAANDGNRVSHALEMILRISERN